jgi:hypothetical protein
MNADSPTKKAYEDRPGWAACFKPKSPLSKASYTGVTVLDGRKYWVNVYLKTAVNGTDYVSVHLQPWEQKEKPQTI